MHRRLATRCLVAIAAAVLGLGFVPAAVARAPEGGVWCGIDYSLARFIGTDDFREPAEIFPGYLNKWNQLYLEEVFGNLERKLGPLQVDPRGVFAANQKATAAQIVHEDGPSSILAETHIAAGDIAAKVASYRLENTGGLGLVLIVDRLVKLQATGCTYIVYFDVASRTVLSSSRVCEGASGFGFRNYWFAPVRDIVQPIRAAYPFK